MTPGALIEKLENLWLMTSELSIVEVPLPSILRSIWVTPISKPSEDFGTFKRITKEAEGKHSPFFYGPLTDKIYESLLTGASKERDGIKLVRRILDHMAAFNHTPSIYLATCLFDECRNGRWAEALFKSLTYALNKNVVPGTAVWADIINYYRHSLNFFETGKSCLDLAIKNNVQAEWELIEGYVNKYLKHGIISIPSSMFENLRSTVIKQSKTPEEKIKRLGVLHSKYSKCLLKYQEKAVALKVIMDYISSEKMSDYSIEVGCKFFEEAKDPRSAVKFFKMVIEKEGFMYTPKFLASSLRMATQIGKEGLFIVDKLEEAIVSNVELSSPFALNMIFVAYGYSEAWDKMLEFTSLIKRLKLSTNKYTVPTVTKLLEKCYEPIFKDKILEVINS